MRIVGSLFSGFAWGLAVQASGGNWRVGAAVFCGLFAIYFWIRAAEEAR